MEPPHGKQRSANGNIDADAYPLSIQVLKEFRGSTEFAALVSAKMSLGSEAMKDIGNVYCAALPAWMAAGMEDAYLRGLDLSGSSAVKKAQGTLEAVPGSWVIGGKIMDLSIMPVRFGPNPIAYLVVGQAVDQDMLNSVTEQTGVAIATAAGQTVMLAAPGGESVHGGEESVLGDVLGRRGVVDDEVGGAVSIRPMRCV